MFLIAALIGWFWGSHNSSGSGGLFSMSPDAQQNSTADLDCQNKLRFGHDKTSHRAVS